MRLETSWERFLCSEAWLVQTLPAQPALLSPVHPGPPHPHCGGKGAFRLPCAQGHDHLPHEPSQRGPGLLWLGWHKFLHLSGQTLSCQCQSIKGTVASWAEARSPFGDRDWPGQGGTWLLPPLNAPTGISLCVPLHNLCNTVTPCVTSLHHPNALQADLISSRLMLNGAREVKEFPQAHTAATWCSKSCALLSFAITCLLLWVAAPFLDSPRRWGDLPGEKA